MSEFIGDVEQAIRISQAFKPSIPVDTYNLFAGRIGQIRKMLNAINQTGQHIVLYGERGIGKTSLASVIGDVFLQGGVTPPPIIRTTCNRKATFDELWRNILRNTSTTLNHVVRGLGGNDTTRTESRAILDSLPPNPLKPDDVRWILQQFGQGIVIVIDELDIVEDKTVVQLLADTIKALSDHAVKATLILVGIGDTIQELIGEHQSIERAIVQLHLYRMTHLEIEQTLSKCLSVAQMTMDPDAVEYIVTLSKGLPHYTHLIGLHAAQSAAQYNRGHIVMTDAREGTNRAIDNTYQSIITSYLQAIESYRSDSLHKYVLMACALAEVNEVGYFKSMHVARELTELLHRDVELSLFARPLGDFTTEKRGRILERRGKKRTYSYRFTNPLMQPYVIMKAIEENIIEYDRIKVLER